MHQQGIHKFENYYVGIDSLTNIADKNDRVCVFNILGSESRIVTPTSHSYSGGNVVFGTSPGKSGKVLETSIGDIPVFNNVTEGLDAGHHFNTAVIYLPPAGVRDAVAEATRINPDLKKIVIVTEKVSVKDARIIRGIGQLRGVDIFGANSLGYADSYNQVRVGGALGGSAPHESLIPGSVAIFSNSGNFTTTIAVYLLTKGWGTTTSVSSGKDVYIHFAAPEFIHAYENDRRSKCAVMYVEPGGYYEYGLNFTKPVVACIVGRWKAKLTKAVGHAGTLAGSGDDAISKEKWFMDYFGVNDIYTPERPVFSEKGAVVNNIAYIPDAVTHVMAANGIESDLEPKGSLSLKPWFGNNQGLPLPTELDIPVVEAVTPYNNQIEMLRMSVGAIFPRQSMKDTSSVSKMDSATQVTRLHNVSILDLSQKSFEENLVFAITKEFPDEAGIKLANIALNTFVNLNNSPILTAVSAAKEAGNSPNTALSSGIGILGPNYVKVDQEVVKGLIELFQYDDIKNPFEVNEINIDSKLVLADPNLFITDQEDPLAERMLRAINASDKSSIFIHFLITMKEKHNKNITISALLAAITTSLAWQGFRKKKLSKITLINMPWYFRLFSTMVGCCTDKENQTESTFNDIDFDELISQWSFGETGFLALVGRKPDEEELFAFNVLMGLLVSNGPGTISAQGSKGAVSADGPEDPFRVQLNKAFIGFMTHSGYAHGGNGYEGMSFLIDQFKDVGLENPGDENHGIDLAEIAMNYAKKYLSYKKEQKEVGNISYEKIPCINHPVFKGKDVNYDPREVYVKDLFEKRDSYNIFLDFYHHLVEALFNTGVSKNIYCVNVDAVIAVTLLKILWIPFKNGEYSEDKLESLAFTTFLLARMIGCSAEIEDHVNRGRNMDTRTPASQCSYVN